MMMMIIVQFYIITNNDTQWENDGMEKYFFLFEPFITYKYKDEP